MTKYSNNKTLNKWMNLVDDKIKWANAPFSEHEIVYFRKAIGSCGLKDSDHRVRLLDHFENLMPVDGYNITEEQKTKGINYLRENTYKKNGQLRKNNIFGDFERHVIENYVDFKFIGVYPATNGLGLNSGYYSPIYRCIASDGTYFDYIGVAYSMIRVLNTSGPANQRLKIV